jgi:hypothetical protein
MKIMKKLKTITDKVLMHLFGFTSGQNEIDDVQGDNSNAMISTTIINIKLTAILLITYISINVLFLYFL